MGDNDLDLKHRETVEKVSRSYNAVAGGWSRWEPQMENYCWPVTQRMMFGTKAAPGMQALDVGCGTGDTALHLAAIVADSGQVVGIDPSSEMLKVAQVRAELLGLNNIEFQVAIPDDLTDGPGRFDVVVGRFCAMFFPDIGKSLAKLRWLMKSGGRIAMATWPAPEDNTSFGIIARAVRSVVEVPPPDPAIPGPHRLAGEDDLVAAISGAGFADVSVERVKLYSFAKSVEEYWEMIMDKSITLKRQFESFSPDQRMRVEQAVKESVDKFLVDGVVRVPSVAQIGFGVCP